ncbi:hypothetical protein I79_019101 [Cricetulus griseus]|uniref:Uncharacterized protein n=1 Tax=Cricetulus griseus TaxID=10029 RepID=G3I6H7_CRIGR|nr:hypothetical protein I79_019101 [Cricetulus griseus]
MIEKLIRTPYASKLLCLLDKSNPALLPQTRKGEYLAYNCLPKGEFKRSQARHCWITPLIPAWPTERVPG